MKISFEPKGCSFIFKMEVPNEDKSSGAVLAATRDPY